MQNQQPDKEMQKILNSVKFSGVIVFVLWLIHSYAVLTEMSLTHWGIYPREVDGMIGIITAPLVHGGWQHLFSNSAPLFVSLTIIHYFYKRVALSAFFLIYFLTGFSVWMFGRSVYHIGASGVVYGLIAFIFWSGVFRRNIKSIVLALVVTIFYFGYLEGIVPFQEGISWESHLMGVFSGILIAFLFKGLIEKDEIKRDPWANERDDEEEYFLERDTFEKTLAQREWEEAQRNRDQDLFYQ